MIMILTATTTVIMAMVATTTMTKNMTTNMATIFKQAQKGYENSVCTSLKNRYFFITQPTKFISSTLYYSAC